MERRDFWHKFWKEVVDLFITLGAIILIVLLFIAPDVAKFLFIPIGIYWTIDLLRYIDEKLSR